MLRESVTLSVSNVARDFIRVECEKRSGVDVGGALKRTQGELDWHDSCLPAQLFINHTARNRETAHHSSWTTNEIYPAVTIASINIWPGPLRQAMKSHTPLSIRLLSHNVRYATRHPFKGEEYWEVRRPRLISELNFNTAHCPESFICLQEVLHGQLQDIISGLKASGTEWSYIGVGRDDGKEAGEYSPIIYQPAVWEVKKWTTLWLSETPHKPSRGWDAACIRILTVGEFRHRQSKKRVVAMSTHLDHAGPRSRLEAAKIILQEVDSFKHEANGIFLAGDFNSPPNTEAYLLMTSDDSSMYDLRDQVPEPQRYGHNLTFSGFQGKPDHRIDYLFLNYDVCASSEERGWKVRNYAVLENKFEDGVYNSDHRAVVGDVELY